MVLLQNPLTGKHYFLANFYSFDICYLLHLLITKKSKQTYCKGLNLNLTYFFKIIVRGNSWFIAVKTNKVLRN